MKIHPVAAAVAAAMAPAASAHSARHRNQFIKAMDAHARDKLSQTPSVESAAAMMSGNSARARALRKKVMEKAKPTAALREMKERGLQNNQNYNNAYYGYGQNGQNNGNGKYYGNNNQANGNYQANQNQANGNYQANQNQANGNYQANQNQANGDYQYANQNQVRDADDYYAMSEEYEFNGFWFDVSQYSLSYAGCAAVKQYDDEVAAQEDTTSVFATKRFVVFRLCPSRTCEGIVDEQNDDDEEEDDAYANQEDWQQNNYNYNYENMEEWAQAQANENDYNNYDNGDYDIYGTENTYDRVKAGGANGEGCQSSYGEYMMELEDYLEAMREYHYERVEAYCNTCEQCMYKLYQTWMKSQNRKLKDVSDASWKDDLEHARVNRELGFNAYGQCPEYDTCRVYAKSCGGVDDSLEEYYQCTEVEGANGRMAYIGPYCAEDGVSVTLGVYSDEGCNNYIGNGVAIENFLGYSLMGDELASVMAGNLEDIIPEKNIQMQKERYSQIYAANGDVGEYMSPGDNMCIPCLASRQPYEQLGNVYDYADYDDDGNQDEINELCTNLYQASARCDKHFRSYDVHSKKAKYADSVVTEDLSCDFIQTVINNDYNEVGFVKNMGRGVDPEAGNNMYWAEYGGTLRRVTGLQIFGLIASLAACLVLGMWSLSLRESLDKSKTWRPRQFVADLKDKVLMGRSSSKLDTPSSEEELNPATYEPEKLNDRNRSYYAS